MLKTLSAIFLGLAVTSTVWANTQTQSYDERYAHWKHQQNVKYQQTSPQTTQRGHNLVALNQASAAELQMKLTGVGAKKAAAIVEYRQKNGNFKSIDELKNVKGIGDKIFEKNRSNLTL